MAILLSLALSIIFEYSQTCFVKLLRQKIIGAPLINANYPQTKKIGDFVVVRGEIKNFGGDYLLLSEVQEQGSVLKLTIETLQWTLKENKSQLLRNKIRIEKEWCKELQKCEVLPLKFKNDSVLFP